MEHLLHPGTILSNDRKQPGNSKFFFICAVPLSPVGGNIPQKCKIIVHYQVLRWSQAEQAAGKDLAVRNSEYKPRQPQWNDVGSPNRARGWSQLQGGAEGMWARGHLGEQLSSPTPTAQRSPQLEAVGVAQSCDLSREFLPYGDGIFSSASLTWILASSVGISCARLCTGFVTKSREYFIFASKSKPMTSCKRTELKFASLLSEKWFAKLTRYARKEEGEEII